MHEQRDRCETPWSFASALRSTAISGYTGFLCVLFGPFGVEGPGGEQWNLSIYQRAMRRRRTGLHPLRCTLREDASDTLQTILAMRAVEKSTSRTPAHLPPSSFVIASVGMSRGRLDRISRRQTVSAHWRGSMRSAG